MRWYDVYDAIGHAALYPPDPKHKLWLYALDDEQKMKVPYPAKVDVFMGVAEKFAAPIRTWLDTLPADRTVSGHQICEVFCPERVKVPGFLPCFQRFLYKGRICGVFDGYYSKSGLNSFKQPYVNYHKKLGVL